MKGIGDTAPAVARFLSYKLSIQGASDKTVYEYGIDLNNFLIYYLSKKHGYPDRESVDLTKVTDEEISEIMPQDIYDYLLYTATSQKNGAAARARKLCAIRGFFKFLSSKEKIISSDPSKDIDSPSVKHALPRFLSEEESRDLMDAVRGTEGANKKRDVAIITLFLNCGMRVSELCGISLGDITEDNSKLIVTGKGSKQRVVYLNAASRKALGDYLEERKKLNSKDPGALFVSRNHKRLSVKTVQWLVYKYLDIAGLGDKGYSVHKLRHTAATLMYNTGKVDVRVLKDILGHEQLNTTQIYTHVSNDLMKKAMEENPLNDEGK